MEVVERVQIISSQTKDSIPIDYIRAEEDRPATTALHGPVPEVPVIDLSEYENDNEKLVRLVAGASKDWGIFHVVNHGVPFDLIEKLQHVGKAFFDLPQDVKEEYYYPDTLEGYGSKVVKFLRGKAWGDHIFHNVWPPSSINYQFWPDNPPSYRAVNEKYARCLRKVINKLFECLSLGLGLEAGALKEGAGGEGLEYLMKINYYPPCPQPDLALGAGPHTDLCTMTVLVPDEVPGLQVFKDGVWINTPYIPGSLTIFIGDQIEIMSNGKYKAVLHRATVNKDKVRMSWPVFVQPPQEMVVGPLPQIVDKQKNPPKYKAKKFKDYTYCKLNSLPQ